MVDNKNDYVNIHPELAENLESISFSGSIDIKQPDCYQEKIEEILQQLKAVLPKVCSFFGQTDFMNILTELEKYDKNVKKHYLDFEENQRIWANIVEHFATRKCENKKRSYD